jgi:hypothetical protein
MYHFGLHLFFFFIVHDSQVWSFDGVTEFLHILFTALEWESRVVCDYLFLLQMHTSSFETGWWEKWCSIGRLSMG